MDNRGQEHVSLGGWEVPADRLQAPLGAEEDNDGAAEALRKLIRRPHGIEPLPEHGWIRLVDSEDLVAFACRSDDSGEPSWVTVAVERNVGEWRFRGSSYGARPEPTRATYGTGLRLAWPALEFVVRVGEHPTLSVLMINERSESWVGQDGAEYRAIASLIDLSTGDPFRPSGVRIAGVGRKYELAPGAHIIELPVALAVEQPNALPPTTFGIKAKSGNSICLWTAASSASSPLTSACKRTPPPASSRWRLPHAEVEIATGLANKESRRRGARRPASTAVMRGN